MLPSTLDDPPSPLWERRYELLAAGILAAVAVLVLGTLLLPEIFWDDFIYRYFWAPIVADAEGRPVDGIREGYNVYNTLVYALVLGGALFGVYGAFSRKGLEVDWTFAAACLPLFLLGGTARALEDATLYRGNVQYLFISPLIYFVIFGIFASFLLIGHWRERFGRGVFEAGMAVHLGLLAAITLLDPEGIVHDLEPAIPLALAVVAVAVFHLSRGLGAVRSSLLAGGTFYLLLSVSYLVAFPSSPEWYALYEGLEGAADPHYWEIVIIPAIAVAITLAIGLLGGRRFAVLAAPMNLLMFFGHFMDGTATYRGIDLYGYLEKHVLPSFLIELTGTAAVMLLLKFVLVVAIIYMLDVLLREEVGENRLLVGMVKATVVFLGLGPGTRDAVRIALGV